MKVCSCGRSFTEAQSSGDVCFKCKLSSVGFTYKGGGGFGRAAFHEGTNREAEAEIVREAAKNGVEVQPVGKRWV
jgi:hypothetical protein